MSMKIEKLLSLLTRNEQFEGILDKGILDKGAITLFTMQSHLSPRDSSRFMLTLP